MLRKQAIWCQCATVFHIVLSVACISSIQEMTATMDIFWFICFTLTSIIIFNTAEHATIVGISPDKWLRYERMLSNVIASTLMLWSYFHWTVFNYSIATFLLAIVFSYIGKRPVSLLVGVWWMATTFNSVLVVVFVWVFAQWWSDHWFKKTLHKSIASYELRYAYIGKTLVILTEAVLLWYLRCLHRFPHNFRWRPVIFGFLSVLLSCLYCHLNIQNTHVSRNAVIKRAGHGMAASLTAANACPVCRTCISQLDMESSFGDGF